MEDSALYCKGEENARVRARVFVFASYKLENFRIDWLTNDAPNFTGTDERKCHTQRWPNRGNSHSHGFHSHSQNSQIFGNIAKFPKKFPFPFPLIPMGILPFPWDSQNPKNSQPSKNIKKFSNWNVTYVDTQYVDDTPYVNNTLDLWKWLSSIIFNYLCLKTSKEILSL